MSIRTKRLFDVVGAIGGLMFFAAVMAAIAAAILLADGRPLLFRQTRLGLPTAAIHDPQVPHDAE
jgi:lipopolysaccharide/colanic/teichoic acid biosynthesis glycosyltransferase